MRFFAEGPSLPSHLLEQQTLGNVIFFCGAGVSMPAGLDSFWQLTDRIINVLDARGARQALAEKIDFDRIFTMLVKDFGRDEIDRQIFDALGNSRARTLAHHRSILQLSKGAAGTPQVITTNFDHLFERANKKVKTVVPPALPNLELNQAIDGVVYLHGRLVQPNSTTTPQYIISSPDFGRAYLAEGWATRFVKELRERYTLVFLGYSANDPPMRYLLEGLNDREGVVYDNPIYAFAPDDGGDGIEVWHDRGVTPIPYAPDNRHFALWETIRLWADSTAEPDKWTNALLELARQGPRNLAPFERGKVVELVSTRKGAKAFAAAEPPISSEWLCVFDPNARYAPARKSSYEDDAEEIDPQQFYGLDDDPPRPPKSENRLFQEGVRNPLAWQAGDGNHPERIGLQGTHQVYNNPLPSRLHSLASWFGSRSHEPTAIWWAAGWKTLNPHLLWFVGNRLRSRHGEGFSNQAAHFWSLYLETVESTSASDLEYRWYEFEGMVKVVGWTGPAMRFLENCARPLVAANRPTLATPLPPSAEWDDLELRNVVELKVRVLDHHNSKFTIPDDQLAKVIAVLRTSILRMVELLNEVGDMFWQAPNLHPSDEPGERYHGRKEQFVLWFTDLFQTLSKHDANAAKTEFQAWPDSEPRVFSKLRIWAACLPGMLTSDEVSAMLAALDDEVFWDTYQQRGILLLLKGQWAQFSRMQRRQIERRIENGGAKWTDESDENFVKRKARNSASRLRWLELNGCDLSVTAKRALNRLKKVDERWNDEWARAADDSLGPRGGWIAENVETRGLESAPLSELVASASKSTEERIGELTHYRPFRGLVAQFPLRAISALRLERRKGNFPVHFWIDLLSNWPDGTSLRLRWLLAHTICSLKDEQALELRYYSADWLNKHMNALYRSSRTKALQVFDGFLRPFLKAPAKFSESSMGDASIGGEVQKESQVSVNKAINSPVGRLTQALWSVTANKGKPIGRLNGNLAARFEKLSRVPGNGSGHAIATLATHLGWIEYRYKDWSHAFLLPKFDLSNDLSEAAWHGLVYNRNPLTAEVFDALRVPWLAILRGEAPWRMNPEHRRILVESMVWLSDPNREGGATFSFAEVRDVLRTIGDQGRGQALWALANSLERNDNWDTFIKPFIASAWPRQLRFKSDETTRGFLQIAEKAGESFPDAVTTIQPLVRPVPNADMLTYRISRNLKDEENIAKDYPFEMLVLLDAITGDDRVQMPYGLPDALKALAELEPRVRETKEFRRLIALVD